MVTPSPGRAEFMTKMIKMASSYDVISDNSVMFVPNQYGRSEVEVYTWRVAKSTHIRFKMLLHSYMAGRSVLIPCFCSRTGYSPFIEKLLPARLLYFLFDASSTLLGKTSGYYKYSFLHMKRKTSAQSNFYILETAKRKLLNDLWKGSGEYYFTLWRKKLNQSPGSTWRGAYFIFNHICSSDSFCAERRRKILFWEPLLIIDWFYSLWLCFTLVSGCGGRNSS